MNVTSTRRRQILVRSLFWVIAACIGLYVLAVVVFDRFNVGTMKLPRPNPVAAVRAESAPAAKYISLPQNWPAGWGWGGREWFHHAEQGTTIMPYAWLVALEQPEIKVLRNPGMFLDHEFMSRFGFLPSAADPVQNPEGRLPIGWAIDRDFKDPTASLDDKDAYNARPYNSVGLTCAACHTGRLTYVGLDQKRVELLIEGGSAMINLRKLQSAIGISVAYTLYVPGRFGRFADRVYGRGTSRAERNRLRGQVAGWFKEAKAAEDVDNARHINQLESGFARTDALSLIGNRVFGKIDPGNLVTAGSPVNFPHIWGTSWFDWVQYNASIRMVMVRNIGEALGVGAKTNVTPGDPRLLQSTVNVANLHRIEDQLGGKVPYGGLLAPKWDDAVRLAGFPPLNPELKEQGKKLYDRHCVDCHGPSSADLKAAHDKKDTKYWEKPYGAGKPPFDQWFLKVPPIALDQIGTDPKQAADFAIRFAKLPDPTPNDTQRRLSALGTAQARPNTSATGAGTITTSAARGLRVITEAIRQRAYDQAQLTPAERAEWDRFRDHRQDLPDKAVLVANLGYKARPLDGIWATPPYLHNASVPNLDALLSPVALRPTTFPVGTTEYDPVAVGYRIDVNPGGFILDTRYQGNANSGHEFRDLTLIELEAAHKIHDFGAGLSNSTRWARLMKLTAEEYDKQTDDQLRAARHKLTSEALESKDLTFFGVIGPGLDPEERKALIEYVKSL